MPTSCLMAGFASLMRHFTTTTTTTDAFCARAELPKPPVPIGRTAERLVVTTGRRAKFDRDCSPQAGNRIRPSRTTDAEQESWQTACSQDPAQ